tara:strand:- start:819 stop:1124 length:306 start_codon:yes stop_codon:yes gene_type:complete
MKKKFESFRDFYPFYLSQHTNQTCRRLHFFGTLFGLVVFIYALISFKFSFIFLSFFIGYFFAWVGHFFFEKNKPATFTYPFYSYLGDWVMFRDVLFGKIKF